MSAEQPIQIKNAIEKFDFCHAELVVGVVCAVGTNYRPIENSLQNILRQYGYSTRTIRVSSLISRFSSKPLLNDPEIDRISGRMDVGNDVCKDSKRQDIWALSAIAEINKARVRTGIFNRTAHLVFSLKRPAEVATLRKVYGDGFFLVGVFATEKERLDYLIEQNAPKADALKLIARDADERNEKYGDYGQHTAETFQLADVFVQLRRDAYHHELQRFFDLVFSNPYVTPTKDEHAMFLAYASSLRSAQLRRQVGAAIASENGDILAVGCNDVPRPGGGLYWPGPFDNRDHIRGEDSNDKERNKMVEDLLQALAEADLRQLALLKESVTKEARGSGLSSEDAESLHNRLIGAISERSSIRDSALRSKYRELLDITEYGRAVHAEMDAILTCARSGVSPEGTTLYTTTFPCHNCTRHIIAAGIRRVYYIEPYAKSKAEVLHEDAILVEEKALDKKRAKLRKVPFTHFVGVGPRRYFDLFSLSVGSGHELRRKVDGKITN